MQRTFWKDGFFVIFSLLLSSHKWPATWNLHIQHCIIKPLVSPPLDSNFLYGATISRNNRLIFFFTKSFGLHVINANVLYKAISSPSHLVTYPKIAIQGCCHRCSLPVHSISSLCSMDILPATRSLYHNCVSRVLLCVQTISKPLAYELWRSAWKSEMHWRRTSIPLLIYPAVELSQSNACLKLKGLVLSLGHTATMAITHHVGCGCGSSTTTVPLCCKRSARLDMFNSSWMQLVHQNVNDLCELSMTESRT